MKSELLIAHGAATARIAVRDGETISAGRFLANAQALARQMPAAKYVLNSCRDRYLFAVTFCAAVIAQRTSLLPPSRTPETLAQLATRYPDTLYVGEESGDIVWHGSAVPAARWIVDPDVQAWPPPAIARQHPAAIAFTSGSTG
ncbi:MAG TPA: beta-hydroxyacyl-ACP dehydratase, partial [Burkholderiaceae bacterium]|nr:beta-hydroxyacyl-ACP dehydratase [Burkholderiaceae bacterium]